VLPDVLLSVLPDAQTTAEVDVAAAETTDVVDADQEDQLVVVDAEPDVTQEVDARQESWPNV